MVLGTACAAADQHGVHPHRLRAVAIGDCSVADHQCLIGFDARRAERVVKDGGVRFLSAHFARDHDGVERCAQIEPTENPTQPMIPVRNQPQAMATFTQRSQRLPRTVNQSVAMCMREIVVDLVPDLLERTLPNLEVLEGRVQDLAPEVPPRLGAEAENPAALVQRACDALRKGARKGPLHRGGIQREAVVARNLGIDVSDRGMRVEQRAPGVEENDARASHRVSVPRSIHGRNRCLPLSEDLKRAAAMR